MVELAHPTIEESIRDGLVNSWVSFFRDIQHVLSDEDARALGNKIVDLTESALDQNSFEEAFNMACRWFDEEYLPGHACSGSEELIPPISLSQYRLVRSQAG